MKSIFTSIVLLLIGNALVAQQEAAEAFFQKEYERLILESKTTVEVWRVDSTYCWTQNMETNQEIPTSRSYNIAFTELKGRVLEERSQNYANGAWLNFEKRNYTYTADDEIAGVLTQGWDMASQDYINKERVNYVFNETAQAYDEIESQNWENNQWLNIKKSVNSYYDNHYKLEQADNYLWENNAYVLDNAFYYAVNANTLLTLGVLFQKRNEAGDLVNFSRTVIAHDEMGNDTLNTFEGNNGSWFYTGRVRKQFVEGKEVVRIDQGYNAANETWVNSQKEEKQYTEAGKIRVVTVFAWNTFEEAFVPGYRTQYIYDGEDNLTEFFTEVYTGNSWIFSNRCIFYWSKYEVETDTENINFENAFTCKMANPIQGGGQSFSCQEWNIEGKGQLEIYDLLGRKVQESTIENQSNIEIKSGLNTGVYTILLRDARGVLWRQKSMIVQ